ncbi:MAG: hypothetical protein ACKPKO_28685, partial [Candidatus Fonsibacter sp.]
FWLYIRWPYARAKTCGASTEGIIGGPVDIVEHFIAQLSGSVVLGVELTVHVIGSMVPVENFAAFELEAALVT